MEKMYLPLVCLAVMGVHYLHSVTTGDTFDFVSLVWDRTVKLNESAKKEVRDIDCCMKQADAIQAHLPPELRFRPSEDHCLTENSILTHH